MTLVMEAGSYSPGMLYDVADGITTVRWEGLAEDKVLFFTVTVDDTDIATFYENSAIKDEGEGIVFISQITYHRFNIYTVTFDSNGGNYTPASQDVKTDSKATEPATDPTRFGYTFSGWYNGEDKWDFDQDTVTSDITLIAKWEPVKVKIEFYDSHYVGAVIVGDLYDASQETDYGSAIAEPTGGDPEHTDEGYHFFGWYTAPQTGSDPDAGSGHIWDFDFPDIATQDSGVIFSDGVYTLKLYAHFHNDHVLRLFKNADDATFGGSASFFLFDAEEGTMPDFADLPEPTREGYVFKGWSTTGSDGSAADFGEDEYAEYLEYIRSDDGSYMITDIFAVWEPITYTLTFDGNGATLPPEDLTRSAEYGSALGSDLPPTPILPGYNFVGWNTSADGSGDFFDETTPVKGDTGLFAQWEEIFCTVSFTDGRGNVIRTETVPYGGTATAPANPSIGGYTFIGWSTSYSNATSDLTVNALWSYNGGDADDNRSGGAATDPPLTPVIPPIDQPPGLNDTADNQAGRNDRIGQIGDDEQDELHVPGGSDLFVPPVPSIRGHTVDPVVSDVGEILSYVEFNYDGLPLGEWLWDELLEEWIFGEFAPLADLPQTGDTGIPAYLFILTGLSLSVAGIILYNKTKERGNHGKKSGN